jgi:S1-C subfamily serine protease
VVAKNFQEQAINFAIPMDRAHQSFDELLLPDARGNFWTGIDLDLATTTVRRVVEKSPAAEAGLVAGDIVTAPDESPVAGDRVG